MPGIYISGKDLPINCDSCPYSIAEPGLKYFCHCKRPWDFEIEDPFREGRDKRCPYTFVSKHGPLIDLDVLRQRAYERNFEGRLGEGTLFLLNLLLESQPVVIPEDKENRCVRRTDRET